MTTRSKICHITSMHNWDDDRIYERACVGLAQLGFDVYQVASCQALNKKSEEGITYTDGEVKEGVKLYWVKKRSGIKRRLISSRQCMKKALRLKPDVIHFHDPDIMPWAYLYSFFYKGAMVFDIHENYLSRIEKQNLPKPAKRILSKLYRGFEKAVIRRCGGFVTTTDTMKDLYKGISTPGIAVSNVPYLKRLEVLPQVSEKEKNITIVTSGTNSDERNCMQTVESMPMVLARFPDAKFKFVGRYAPDNYGEMLMNKAKELNVAHALSIEGMMPWLANFERIARAHIGCVFYADNLNNRVTIPNRLFEYMSMSLAIVGEDFPEVKKVLTEAGCGVAVNSSDPKSIAEGICKLLEQPQELLNMGKRGADAVKKRYNFENELQKLSNFYQEITSVQHG